MARIADRIVKARLALRLTQVQYAKLTGIPRGTIRHWEQQRGMPELPNILQLARSLRPYGFTADWLLGLAEEHERGPATTAIPPDVLAERE